MQTNRDRVLAAIRAEPGLSGSAIMARTFLSRRSFSHAVKRLVADGLVKKVFSIRDIRSPLFYPAEAMPTPQPMAKADPSAVVAPLAARPPPEVRFHMRAEEVQA